MSDPSTDARDDGDAKAWFYLDHREDIETWAALREEGRQLLDRHLVGIAALLEGMAGEVNARFYTDDLDSGPWPRAGLSCRHWLWKGWADVSVVVQWERGRLLTPGSNEWPYVGVRIRDAQADEDRRRQIVGAMKPVLSNFTGKPTRNFPVWRYVRLPAN